MMNKTEYPRIGEVIYSDVLSNGLRISVIPKPGFSTCYAAFATNYGGAHRRFELNGEIHDTPAGIAHYLEHKMFDLPDGDNALSVLSANGADPNAFTSSGMTCYFFRCTEGFEENLRMLLHFVSTPYFTDETVEKERGIIAQEILMGDDSPGIAIYYGLLKLLYDHHPIREQVAGSVESIQAIDKETLYNCHKVFYAPSNMVLCVEGDVDPEKVKSIAEEMLSGELSPIPHADFGEDEGIMPVDHKSVAAMELSAPQFLIGAKIKPETAADKVIRQRLISTLALRVFIGDSSPFYNRLYEDGTLNSDFDYEVDYTADTATLIIGGESQEPEKVLELLLSEVEELKKHGLDNERFERSKRASIGSRLRALEDFESTCLSVVTGMFDGYDAFNSPAVLETVTKEECEQFLIETLTPDRLAISIITPKKD